MLDWPKSRHRVQATQTLVMVHFMSEHFVALRPFDTTTGPRVKRDMGKQGAYLDGALAPAPPPMEVKIIFYK